MALSRGAKPTYNRKRQQNATDSVKKFGGEGKRKHFPESPKRKHRRMGQGF